LPRTDSTDLADRPYFKIAVAYAKKAQKSKDHGKWSRLACRRFLDDLKKWDFDKAKAENACYFMDQLPHVKGNWGTREIVWHDSYVLLTCALFGFRRKDGRRRFTDVLLWIARKNAKSLWAAGIGLYALCADGENGPEVISAATTGAQARIVWNLAKRQVEMTPDLADFYLLEAMANSIPCWSNGGYFQPVNSKASTLDGLNPSCTIVDEIHAHKDPNLINVLVSAAGARSQPLRVYVTTEGYMNPGPWPELRSYAQGVLSGAIKADHFLAMGFAIDKGDDEFDPKCWIKANPLISVNPLLQEQIETAAAEAKAMPNKRAEFVIKRCNRAAAASDSWVDLQEWLKCTAKPVMSDLCYGGMDLASTRDMASWGMYSETDGVGSCIVRNFIPEDKFEVRRAGGMLDLVGWRDTEHLIVTPGKVIDNDIVLEQILQDCEKYGITTIAYDPWNSADIVKRLTDAGITMFPSRQGAQTYHPSMQYLEEKYIGGLLRHGGNPVLDWQANNMVPRFDVNLNMAPDKRKSADKIDGMCALLMAIGNYLNNKEEYIGELTVV
jgi:phage terminase large subunit-like protein